MTEEKIMPKAASNDEPPWLPPCRDAVSKLGGVLCDPSHCDSSMIKNYTHAICTCDVGYENGCKPTRYDGCCSYTMSSPVPIYSLGCYCCCGCFASDTPVAVDRDKYKAIGDFRVGDMVYVADDLSLEKWSQRAVRFSSGTGDMGVRNTLIMINYGRDGKEDYLFASRDQLFLMPDKRLKRASKLVPGKDELVMYDGAPVPIISMEVGSYEKGVHHIATSAEPAVSVDGHLILAKGIVSGDYALQISNLEAENDLLVENHENLPDFGTSEYIEMYKELKATSFKAELSGYDKSNDKITVDSELFRPLGVKGPAYIPEHAQYFVSKEQARDIFINAPRQSPASDAGRDMTNYLFKLYKAFYPQVHFYLDEENDMPNAFSFIEYGMPFVVVTGGLIRTDAVKYEALAYIIAHEIGHLYGGAPLNDAGYSCTGKADYAAINAVMPYVWIGLSSVPIVQKAIGQIKELFSFISPEHAKGRPGDKCMNISIECRLKAMEAATHISPLPECAGGPPDPALEVKGAVASEDKSGKYVTIEFNSGVDKTSAEALGHYSFTPKAPAYSARVDSEGSKVIIKIDIQEEVEYEVYVFDVLTKDKRPLVFDKDHATFTLKKTSEK